MAQTRMEVVGQGGFWVYCEGSKANRIYCWAEGEVGEWKVDSSPKDCSLEATGRAGLLFTEMGNMEKGTGLGVCQDL